MILLDGNFLTATMIGVICACGAFFDILGDKRQSSFPHLPKFIRWEIRVTVGVLAVRMANLYSMVNEAPVRLGEANLWATLAALCLMVTVISLTAYTLSLHLPARAWDRLRFARETMARDPEQVPMMVTKDDVTAIHRASGQPAVGPRAASGEVASEGPRLERMRDHARRA